MESYFGYIESVNDALLVFEACRLGILRRVQRRLSEKERQTLRSGSVYVWDEEESGMRRWTDGRTWSPSRVLGCFLTYRELDSKRKGGRSSDTGCPSPSSVYSDNDGNESQRKADFRLKEGGLIKQSLSVCTANNRKLHLICYYSTHDIQTNQLKIPTFDPLFSHITIPTGLYPEMVPETNHSSSESYGSSHYDGYSLG